MLGAAGGLALALVLWGGYSRTWTRSSRSWTGFTGNTLWGWMHLLLLPLLLPTVIVPALTPMAMGRVAVVAGEEDETPTSTAVNVAPPLA